MIKNNKKIFFWGISCTPPPPLPLRFPVGSSLSEPELENYVGKSGASVINNFGSIGSSVFFYIKKIFLRPYRYTVNCNHIAQGLTRNKRGKSSVVNPDPVGSETFS